MRLNPIIKPYYKKPRSPKSKEEDDLTYPIYSPYEVPKIFRKFCCFVGITSTSGTLMGSGTLVVTKGITGIVTAQHLLAEKYKGINVAFLLPNNDWIEFAIPKEYLIISDPELDVALFKAPPLPSEFQPVEIGWEAKVPFIPHLYAFGCPNGILGKVWKPKFITLAGGLIYTKGFAVPGVSGGGLFAKWNNRYYLWGIHVAIHLYSYTLLSRTLQFEIKTE